MPLGERALLAAKFPVRARFPPPQEQGSRHGYCGGLL